MKRTDVVGASSAKARWGTLAAVSLVCVLAGCGDDERPRQDVSEKTDDVETQDAGKRRPDAATRRPDAATRDDDTDAPSEESEPAAPSEPGEPTEPAPDAGDALARDVLPVPQREGETKAIATVASPVRPRAVPFYGTDLGWTFAHGDDLWVLFGDTWASLLTDSIAKDADDALGKISLKDFPDGDAVDRWVATHPPARAGAPTWHAEAPFLRIEVDDQGKPVPMRPLRNGTSLTSGPGLTPMAGWSNARTGAAAGAFGLFLRNEPVQCGDDGACADGFDCDADLGQCAPVTDISAPCVMGTKTCQCVRVGNAKGLCQDRGSSVYDARSERGRSNSVLMRQQVGNALRSDHTRFASQPWDTRRFYNVAARAVRDFDASRPYGAGNDYTVADGKSGARDGVFVWGRPSFGGVRGTDARLYLAWVPMPDYDERGRFAWKPQYFAGVDERGRPRFVAREVEAVEVDLDAAKPGVQPEEAKDMVGQMSISWIPALDHFVMLYGGGIGTGLSELIFGADLPSLKLDRDGPIYVRYAKHPWGPWTAPTKFVVAGDPDLGPKGHFGPGGLLHHDGCLQAFCAPGELGFVLEKHEFGRLYAPAIIEPWTETRPDGAVDLYWHVSTWNPYQVVLMKSTLKPVPASGG